MSLSTAVRLETMYSKRSSRVERSLGGMLRGAGGPGAFPPGINSTGFDWTRRYAGVVGAYIGVTSNDDVISDVCMYVCMCRYCSS